MNSRIRKILSVFMMCLFILSISGAYAIWIYYAEIEAMKEPVSIGLGEFEYDPGEILYISEVELYSSSGFSNALNYSKALPTNIKVSGNVQTLRSSVTYKVTVFNNTDLTYWYVGQKLPDYGTNALISSGAITILTKEHASDNSITFNASDWIPARTKRDFYVTYTFNSSQAVTQIDLTVNYYFSIKIDGVQDEFLKILNDKESANGYYYLAGAFDDNYSKNKTDTINNVTDKTVFDNLFGGNLTVDVNGVQTPVTVTVQRKNVDKATTGDSYSGSNAPTGCEYTVYVTTDTLTAGGTATVYAVSYTCGADGVWYQIGQLYEGKASVVNSNSKAVVDVNSWIATEKLYVIYDGNSRVIEYWVGKTGSGTNFDILKTIEQIMSTNDTELYNKIDGSNIFKDIYDILNSAENKYSDAPEVVNLRHAFEQASPYYEVRNSGKEVKYLGASTRGEIVPYLEKICQALEYYYTVHG